ncbi:MAG: aspartate-semialdehyde dehydrogenase [Erysipelotrichaceae bacterium]|nr:aspartate-semialdehyde dehydrogenase [Erysipelotrichaceae bacterium]
MKTINVAILGASGVVGQQMLSVILERKLPIQTLRLLASDRSAGTVVNVMGQSFVIEETTEQSFEGIDYVLGAVSNEWAIKYAPAIAKAKAVFIDNSSAFRLDPKVPLMIPEVNPEMVYEHSGIIANPNCVTIIGLMAAAPIHRVNLIQSMIISSYQAVSGAGVAGMQELQQQMKEMYLQQPLTCKVFPEPICENLLAQIGDLDENGYSQEEMKFQNEGRRILNAPELKVSCTCVRVPVMRSHSLVMRLQLEREMSCEEVKKILEQSKGVRICEPYPTPLMATCQDQVLVGRIRKDLTDPKGIILWVIGDQLRKGAATNAVQIMELLMNQK